MAKRPETIMCWSGGKDSAYALWRLQSEGRYAVRGLLTTVTEGYGRISMHGVRNELLERQAVALGLPLHRVSIPPQCSNEVYQERMGEAVAGLVEQGITAFGFGDLYLEDIRAYREAQLAAYPVETLFPLWGEPTAELARRMIAEGFRATLCCIDPRVMPPELAGRAYDEALLGDLPEGIDPCGENGEFHTFVHDAPNFRSPIPVVAGEQVLREGFRFADLLPGDDLPGDDLPADRPARASGGGL